MLPQPGVVPGVDLEGEAFHSILSLSLLPFSVLPLFVAISYCLHSDVVLGHVPRRRIEANICFKFCIIHYSDKLHANFSSKLRIAGNVRLA